MPTYYTPPQTPITPSSPSLSRSNSYSTSTNSTSRSSTNTSNSSSHRRSRLSRLGLSKEEAASAKKKIPYVFLGSIAAATLVAHKYWPKGFPHGDKEDWELSELGLRAKQRRLAEKAEKAARRGGAGGGADADYGCDDRGRSRGDNLQGGRLSGGYLFGDEEEVRYSRDDRAWTPGRNRSRRGFTVGRGRSRSRDRDLDRDRYIEPPYRRATNRERTELCTTTDGYYPPASTRYRLEPSIPAAGPSSSYESRYLLERTLSNTGSATGSRFSTSSQRRYYEDDHPGEVVYVYRDSPSKSRRASFDVGGTRGYVGGCDWYDR
jgi:hypothetical protein